MEDSELSVTVEEAPAAVQQDEGRNVQREGSERHLVAERTNSECWYINSDEATFNLRLKAMFTVTLIFAVITIFLTEHILKLAGYSPYYPWARWYEQLQIKQTGVIFVAKFAAVLTAGVLMKKTEMLSGPRRKEEGETHKVSFVLHV